MLRDIPYFDAHCDALHYCMEHGAALDSHSGQCDLRRLNWYRPSGQIFAVYQDAARCAPEELPGRVARQLDIYFQAKAAYGEWMEQCFLSMEGAELMGCDPAALEQVYGWGIRSINLTWNHSNDLAGAVGTDGGLTDLGQVFVREAERLGVYLDVSHLGDRAFWELADMAGRPLLATHSNSRAVHPARRNLTDDMFRAVRDLGGVVGLTFYSNFVGEDPAPEDIVPHLEHFLDLGGEDTLCLGCDFDGSDGNSSGLRGVEDVGELYGLLEGRGYGEEVLKKLFYANLARMFPKADCGT